MSSEVECIEVPMKLMAYQFKGHFEAKDTPLFVARHYDINSLKYREYEPGAHAAEKESYYSIVNKRTNAMERVHEGDWFVQYVDKVVIVPEVDFIKNYIQLSEQFRIMIGTVLI